MKLKNVIPIIAMLLVVFISGCKKDDLPGIRPAVASTDPINEATSISINSKISATFTLDMNPSTITSTNFTLKKGTEVVLGTVELTGKMATFTPSENLSPNSIYTATITTGAKSVSGESLEKNYAWTFTTSQLSDLAPPTVTLTNPVNSAIGVSLNHLVVVTFSEPMDPLTINVLTFTLKQGSTSISGTVTNTSSTATFTPTVNLEPNKIYTATVSTAVKDLAGNALISNHTFSFTTGDAPDTMLPMVNSIDPLSNATGVARNKVVAITFSEAMDPSTITDLTFTLKQGETAVTGTVELNLDRTTATFTPSNVLAVATIYTAKISTGAKDLAGNALASKTEWSFTTGGSSSVLAKVELGTAGNYVILAKTTITNIPTSDITGDIALSPAATSFITGFVNTLAGDHATDPQVHGNIYAATMDPPTPINLTTAVNNMITAYNDAAGRPTPDFLELGTGNIGGRTLAPGLYKWAGTVTIPTDITISGSATDVWIFQIGGGLIMSSAVNVTLGGTAKASNIFWQVAGQANFASDSHFEGVILGMTSITFQTNATFNGRALAQTAVILDKNIITTPL
ncbi:MAG: DUF3494 domain-containing protein [Bacteroidales bacterium]|nr:MAG: DUF3494 domain-containing protein [Bacteroidales bacterium]